MISDFDSFLWMDPWFRSLSLTEKLLFIYLQTNSHKNVVALYPIPIKSISTEIEIPLNKVEGLLRSLDPKVLYDFDKNIVWVKDHVREQFFRNGVLSPKIKVHIHKNLLAIAPHPFIDNFLDYYHYLHLDENITTTLSQMTDTVSKQKKYCTSSGSGSIKGESEEEGPF